MEIKTYLTVGTFPKFSRKMVERDKIDTSNTQKQIFKKSAVILHFSMNTLNKFKY